MAATKKMNGAGGGISTVVIVFAIIIIFALGFFVATIINVSSAASPMHSTMHSMHAAPHMAAGMGGPMHPVYENVVFAAQQVTPQELSPSPPIYPRDNPEYPMQRGVIPADYQQVGMLVSKDAADDFEPVLLPLFGRKMITRDRWEYYTASDKFNMWKLPVMYDNRDCQSDVGCNEIYNGVDVVIPDYANKVFTARIYKYGNARM